MSTANTSTKPRRILGLLRESLAGKELDFTTGGINRAIFLLAVPMVLEMVMESLFAVVDVYFVGKLGKGAVATVGLTESLLAVVYSLAMGLGMGATAVIARRTGEQNHDEASHSAAQALYPGLVLSALISLAGLLATPQLLRWMGTDEALIQEYAIYPRIMLTGNVVIILLFLINGIFRGAGQAAIAMRSLWIANGINIVLCPALIYGIGPVPALGLKGAAIATAIGRGAGVVYQLFHLFGGSRNLKVLKRHLRPDWSIIAGVLKVSAGGAGQFLIGSASWIFLVRILSHFGEDALAGYTIALRVLVFAILPAWGLANAGATLVGQNLGAGQPERAEQSVWKAGRINMIFLGSVGILSFAFAPWIMQQFSQDAAVIATGIECLRCVSLGYIFYAYGMVLLQAFNGAGDTRTPILVNICGFWLFQIPMAYLMAIQWDLGPKGVFLAIPLAESLMAVASFLIFRRGKWKAVRV